MNVRIDIGCGDNPKEGYIGIDKYVEGPNIRNFPMDELPFEPNSVDEIFSSHALEHVGKLEVPAVLEEWRRVLKPGGLMILEVPDLEWCVKLWLEHKNDTDWYRYLDVIFGLQTHEGEYHKTGFTEKTLQMSLMNAGFALIRITTVVNHGQHTLQAICKKL